MLFELKEEGIHCWMDGEALFKDSQQRGFFLFFFFSFLWFSFLFLNSYSL